MINFVHPNCNPNEFALTILNQVCDSDSYCSEIRFCIQIINRFQTRVVVKIQSRIHILNPVYDSYSVCSKYAILKIDYDPFCTSKLQSKLICSEN